MSKTKARPDTPKAMRLTKRDKDILETIYHFEGLMSRRQIAQIFFDGKDGSPIRTRLRSLFENKYLMQPDADLLHRTPEMIYWLDKAGLEVVAGLHGDNPQYREMRKREAPKWSTIEHDLAVNDFRITVIEACRRNPTLDLQEWRGAWELATYQDEIIYVGKDGHSSKRRMKPDGYFVVASPQGRSRLLLEIDRANEQNPRILKEKVFPGIAYLKSDVYEQRFGHKSGRWLIVTSGDKHLANMKHQTETAVGAAASLFFFTTFQQVQPDTVLTAPIWYQGGKSEPIALFNSTASQNP